MRVLVTSSDWAASTPTNGTLVLQHGEGVSKGWYRLSLSIETTARQNLVISLRKESHGPSVQFLLSQKQQELLFYSPQPLRTLWLQLSVATGSALPDGLSVALARICCLRSVSRMLRMVSQRDRCKGIAPSRIYRKSWARWRRHGWDGCLERLIREYHPHLLSWSQVADPYAAWIRSKEAKRHKDPAEVQRTIARIEQPLRFSAVMELPGAPGPDLSLTIHSFLKQSYPHWELWLKADHLFEADRSALEHAMTKNSRVRILPSSGHLALSGRYLAFPAPGDALAKHALFSMVQAIQAHREPPVIYSDDDTIDEMGRRSAPNFKPDWNPDLFLSRDYIRNLALFRRDLLPLIQQGRSTEERLFLSLPHIDSDRIAHVPEVLYHHRARGEADHEANAVSSLALRRRYFRTMNQPGVIVTRGRAAATWRIRYPIPEPAPQVSLLIPTRNQRRLLEPCVRSVLDKTTYRHFEIVILDNQSDDPETLQFLETIAQENEQVRILRYDRPFNFSAINNFGVRHARGDLIGLLNNDTEVIAPDWLDEMVSHACRPDIGCVGAKLYYGDETIQHGGVILGLWGVAGHAHKRYHRQSRGYQARAQCIQNYSAVTAACLLIRKPVYEQVGGLNEAQLKVAFNDVDLCLRVRQAGYRNVWTPYAELYHHESVSRGACDTPEQRARERQEIDFMKAAWANELRHDPCYSPHLTRCREDFSINIDP